MAGPPIVEIREPGRPVRRRVVDRSIVVGREGDGEVLADEGVSRRHLRLVPSPVALSVVDLGSRNGTRVNGVAITGRVALEPGAVVRLGSSEIVMVGRVERAVPSAAPATTMMAVPAGLLTVPPPPPAPAPPRPEPRLAALRGRLLGTSPRAGEPLFPAYTEMRSRVPLPAWHAIRAGSVLAYLALCVALFVRPAGGLFVFFKIIVPLLPILFFTAPGLWRNICPLAASNQLPRVLGFTRALTPPDWLRRRGYVIAVVLFFGITGARLALFNVSGPATGILLSVTIVNALLAGVAFKGKSGWCSSTCPLLPLQRVYGQTPFAKVPNSHCQPCVGCTKNCYDFRPSVAYQADLHEADPDWTAPRKLFVAALPGFVLGFFTLLTRSQLPLPHLYLQLAGYFLGSVGLFYAVQGLLPVSTTITVAVWASVAINIFYWFAGVTLASSFATVTGLGAPWLRWPVRALVLALSLLWIARTWVKGRQYEEEVVARAPLPLLQITPRAAKAVQRAVEPAGPEVRFDGRDAPVRADVGASLLELAERAGLPIEAGCRMGVCGADPVAVREGGDCLSPPDDEEVSTLRRLGFAPNTRMACCARVQSGPVTVGLAPEPGGPPADGPPDFDRSIVSVVVLGNGIAGVTAADFVRRGHPDCEIHVVGGEPHVLYNRMGISRLVFGRSAMQGLYLLPEQWYDDHQIVAWLNTVVRRIDPVTRRVFLATGDVLPYDRLILAMGSTSTVPPVAGIGRPGSFVLRTAADAMLIRAYAQEHGCRDAVVSGGGLLGLEAAHSLHELGLRVTVLERGERLLSRQIDAHASGLVDAHFAGLGMRVLYRAEATALAGADKALAGADSLGGVALADGRTVPCDLYLAAVGIRPAIDIARQAGLATGRGIVVNDRMETSIPGVFAAGDVAEHDGRVLGLWPIAAKQGEVAAVNAIGGSAALTAEIPATILKGVGLDLFSIGQVAAADGDEVIVSEDRFDPGAPSYRRLLVRGGRAAGGLVLGHQPEVVAAVTAAVKKGIVVDGATQRRLRGGDWAALAEAGQEAAGRAAAPAGAGG
jgi:nitrite reductase (NADH) large subunit